jgi:ElaB/YqjD/DUF883 family membrane-anchored ribosome-binding protein
MADTMRSSMHGEHMQHEPGNPAQFQGTATGVAEKVKEKARDMGESASEFMSGAKEKVQEWASDAADIACQAKDKARELGSTAMHKAQDWGEDVTSMIRRYPVTSLLVAFGVGLLAACALTRNRS